MLQAHVADVYGLSTTPAHPMLLVSSSRDNTFRLWSIADLLNDLKKPILEALVKGRYQEASDLLSTVLKDETSEEGLLACRKMLGVMGKAVANKLCTSDHPVEKWKCLMNLISVS